MAALIPVWDSDYFFGPHSCHVDQNTFQIYWVLVCETISPSISALKAQCNRESNLPFSKPIKIDFIFISILNLCRAFCLFCCQKSNPAEFN